MSPTSNSPLLEKIKQNKVAIGTGTQSVHEPEMLANLGFDWFWIDQTFSDNDWNKTQTLLWTGEAANITPIVRVASQPQIGYDHRIAVDVTRAQGLGAQFVLVSYSGPREISECLVVAKDWHRRPVTAHPFRNLEWRETIDKMGEQAYIVPQAQCEGGLEAIEETMSLPGLKMFFLSMFGTNLSITKEKEDDFEDPRFWKYLRQVAELGQKRGLYVGANTACCYTVDGTVERIKRLVDAGMKLIMVEHTGFLFQVSMLSFLDGVRSDLQI